MVVKFFVIILLFIIMCKVFGSWLNKLGIIVILRLSEREYVIISKFFCLDKLIVFSILMFDEIIKLNNMIIVFFKIGVGIMVVKVVIFGISFSSMRMKLVIIIIFFVFIFDNWISFIFWVNVL